MGWNKKFQRVELLALSVGTKSLNSSVKNLTKHFGIADRMGWSTRRDWSDSFLHVLVEEILHTNLSWRGQETIDMLRYMKIASHYST